MAAIDVNTPVSVLIKVGLVLLSLGFLFHVVGFCSPFWHVSEFNDYGHRTKVSYGLWKHCREETQYRHLPYELCFSLLEGDFGRDYIRAAQFFETIGFLSAILSIILLLLAICVAVCNDRRILPILSAVVAVAAAGCVILGCIIFGGKDVEKQHLSWAFAFALIGGLFYGVAGVLILVATLFSKKK